MTLRTALLKSLKNMSYKEKLVLLAYLGNEKNISLIPEAELDEYLLKLDTRFIKDLL